MVHARMAILAHGSVADETPEMTTKFLDAPVDDGGE